MPPGDSTCRSWRRDDADPKPDFSGKATPVLILKREQKK
jgi:hypothetical protein